MTVRKGYVDGVTEVLTSYGLKEASAKEIAVSLDKLEKDAAMFNFSDSMDTGSSGFSMSSVLVPLLAAAAAGYIGYNARDKGFGHRSAFDNVKNYLVGTADKYVRRTRPRPLYDIRRYIDR